MNISIILSIVILIMFVIMFVFVIRIWNFQQEILHSGGYPAVICSRAKRDARAVLSRRVPWDYEIDEIIEILSRYPDDPEASDLVQRLTAHQKEFSENKTETNRS
jgi:hypothetical protein